MNILFYSYGCKRSGMGHIKRSIALANELRDRGHAVRFLTHLDTPGEEIVTKEKYWLLSTTQDDIENRIEMNEFKTVDMAIIDIADGPSGEMIDAFKKRFSKVVAVSAAGYAP